MNQVVKRIKDLAAKQNLSQNKLAQKAHLPQSTINSIFNSVNDYPSIPTLEAICKAFDITVAEFFSDGTTPRSLTREQYAMFQRWSALTDEQKELILKLIENMK